MGLLFALESKYENQMMSIGDNLKQLRKRRGLTQAQLAEAAGLQLTQISRLENDDTDPKASTLFKLIDALGCSAEDLMMSVGNQNEPAFIKRTVNRINMLTPLKRYVVLDMINAYCKANTIDESDFPLTSQGDLDGEYFKALKDDHEQVQFIMEEMESQAR